VNSVDFKVRQKTEIDAAHCTLGGKPFQTHAAVTGNCTITDRCTMHEWDDHS